MDEPIVAIISPNGDSAYSETFIKAHKQHLAGSIKYYQWGFMPTHLEGFGDLRKTEELGILERAFRSIRFRFGLEKYEEPSAKAFKESLVRENVQVVLAEYGPTGASVVDTCKALNLPLIVHFHGQDASDKDFMKPYLDGYKKCFEYASYIIAVSNDMVNSLLELGCPKEKLILNTYGPNDVFSTATPDAHSQQVIAIGRFVNKKAPMYTVLAFQKVLSEVPTAKLVMVGDGPLWESCINLAKHLKLENNISFRGVLSVDQILAEINRSAIFTQHSVTDLNGNKEGTPLAVLEASSAALPIVATAHAGIADVVVNDETGYLLEEHDVNGIADKVIHLLKNPEKGQILGKNGRQRVAAEFSMEKHINKLNELVTSVLISTH